MLAWSGPGISRAWGNGIHDVQCNVLIVHLRKGGKGHLITFEWTYLIVASRWGWRWFSNTFLEDKATPSRHTHRCWRGSGRCGVGSERWVSPHHRGWGLLQERASRPFSAGARKSWPHLAQWLLVTNRGSCTYIKSEIITGSVHLEPHKFIIAYGLKLVIEMRVFVGMWMEGGCVS